MKKLLFPLLLIVSIVSFNCENSIEEEDFPFEFRIVVRGVIEPYKQVNNIYIGRTIPISDTFIQGFADVSDAAAAILYEGKLYPLRHTTKGIYRNDTLPVLPGKTYQLFVQLEDKLATAETTVPVRGPISRPVVRSIGQGSQVKNFVECNVTPQNNEVYSATWVVLNLSGSVSSEATELAAVVRKANSGATTVTTDQVPANYNSSALGMRLFIYDAPFYDYFFSQGSNRTSDLVFGQPQNNVRWNVQADGIGMFIAKRDTLMSVN